MTSGVRPYADRRLLGSSPVRNRSHIRAKTPMRTSCVGPVWLPGMWLSTSTVGASARGASERLRWLTMDALVSSSSLVLAWAPAMGLGSGR